jgi:pilus assembly protein Flp/PilA
MYDLATYIRIRLAAAARTERGASAVEYGLLVALIAIIIIVAVSLLGSNLSGIFNKTATSSATAADPHTAKGPRLPKQPGAVLWAPEPVPRSL